MINLDKRDRDVTRFLWLEDINDDSGTITVYRFKVVLFGATCSHFLLNACIREHVSKYPSKIGNLVKDSIYVDNFLNSGSSEAKLVDFYNNTKPIMKDAGFNIKSCIFHNWLSHVRMLGRT